MKKVIPTLVIIAVPLLLAWGGHLMWSNGSRDPGPGLAASASASHTGDAFRFATNAPQLTMIRAERVESSAIPMTDALSARVVYDEDATARISVGISGRIVAIAAALGEPVKAGQVLAEIDSGDVGSASADLGKAHADEKRKRLAVERARSLVPGEAIAIKEWESIQADYAQAQAETLRAQQRLRNLNPRGLPMDGQRVKLTSPIAGVVTERNVTPALEVAPGMAAPLFVVTNASRLWLLVDLPEKLFGRVRRGSAVDVESDAYPGEHFTARVIQLGQIVDPNTRRVTMRARIDNPSGKLLPEMFVRARVLQESGHGVRVPNGAIINQGLYNYVFVQTAPREFRRQRVTLAAQDSDSAYVTDGLRGNESVVISGAMLLDAEMATR